MCNGPTLSLFSLAHLSLTPTRTLNIDPQSSRHMRPFLIRFLSTGGSGDECAWWVLKASIQHITRGIILFFFW